MANFEEMLMLYAIDNIENNNLLNDVLCFPISVWLFYM